MAERLGDAILKLRTDDRKLRRGLRTAEGGARRLNSVFKTVGVTIAAAFSVRAIGRFASEVIKAADVQIQAERQLATALEVTGQATAGALDGLKDFASSLQSITTVGDEAALKMLQVATNMGLTAEQSKLAVKEAIGVSAAFGIAETSAIRYTAALQQGDTTMLNRYIPTLRLLDDDAERVAKAHDILGGAFQGAVTEAESGLGPYRQLQNRLGDLQEVVGVELLDSLQDVIAELKAFADTDEAEQAAKRLGETMATLFENVVDLTTAIDGLLKRGQPLADLFNQISGAAPDPARLRGLAVEVEAIERFLTFDLARAAGSGQTAIAGRIRALADSIEDAAERARVAKGDFDLSGVLEDANDEIDRLMKEGIERMKRDVPDAADAVEDLGKEASKTARELDQELAEAMIRLNNLAEDLERQIGDDLADFLGLDDPVKIEFEVEAPDIDVIDLFGIPEVEREVNETFARIAERVTQDVGRAIAQAIISGDVDNAIDAFSRALEAAVADALTQAIAAAFAEAALSTVAAASFAGIILARLFEVGPFEKDTGRRLGGDVTIGPGGVTTPPDFESASRETAAAFAALDAAITEGMDQLQETLRFEIPAGFEDTVVFVQARVKDGREMFDVIFRDFAEGLEAATATFESAEAAAGFALQKFTQSLLEQGVQFDAAVTELIQGFGAGLDPEDAGFENFQDALTRVQELADQAAMSLDGVSEVELALQRIGPQAQALARELTGLGLSAAETRRLVGGQLVQSFQTLRQQITGEELSVARRREIAQANAELFNAELELQIARLEAEKSALLAEAGIAEQEVKLHGNVIDARSRFVGAQGKVFNAELGVMGGFVKGAGAVLRSGIELIGDTSRALGDALGSLPEEIRKQVQAIQKVIDALRRIGTISPGDIRIPGARGISGIGRGGFGGGRGVDGAARAAREELDRLIRSLDELASETIRNIDVLEGAVDGLEALRDEISLTTQTAPQQLATVRSRLLAAAARFRAGDVSAAADVQQLGRLFSQLTGRQFSSLTAGFQSRQRFLEDLLNETIRSGEEQLETERDLLESLNERQAGLLQQLVALGELTQDQIDEIRTRGEEETGATRDVEDRVEETNRKLDRLAKAVEALAREAARNAKAA